MSAIPFPNIAQDSIAIAGQNSMQEYARAAQEKQSANLLAQQSQGVELENQQKQLDLKNQQLVTQLYPQHVIKDPSTGAVSGYDWNGLAQDAMGHGVSPQYVTGLQMNIAKARSDMAGATKAERDNQDAINGQATDMLEGIKGLTDPAQRQAAYQKVVPFMQGHGLDVSQFPAQVPMSNDDLTHLEVPLGMHKQIISEGKEIADANQANEKARADAATAAHQEFINGLTTKSKPSDYYSQIDAIYPPSDPKTGGQNQMVKAQVDGAMSRGDLEGAKQFVDQAFQNVQGIQKDIAVNTNPQIQQGKVAVATAEGAARANIEAQQARGSNAALAQVPPHLVAPATQAADKAGQDYAQSQSVNQRLQAMMDAAKNGNVVSYQLIPEEGALQVTTSQGVHRINMAEIQNYGGGSLWQRMQGHIGKALTGESIPGSVLTDMAEMQKIQAQGAQSKYNNALKTINQTYGAKFEPVPMDQTAPTTPAAKPDTSKAAKWGTPIQ
jgi:hypothetical protein